MFVGAFLVAYVLMTTLIPAYWHWKMHEVLNISQIIMSFFLGMNFIVCFWEIGLGLNIDHINADYKRLARKYRGKNFTAVVDFFMAPLSLSDMCSLKYWGSVWSTYSLYDPSYSNRESFGFFIDVGNGWSTLIPTVLFQVAMTDSYGMSPMTVGLVGLLSFYQEFYGTCVYFLSFILNKRYKGRSFAEVALFVGMTNGIWFMCPLLGMYLSYEMVVSGNFDCVRI